MRNLDAMNPKMLRPSKFAVVSACAPLFVTLLTIPVANGAAPNVPLVENPIVVLLSVISLISLGMIPVPAVFRWGWRAEYYGFSLLCLASISLLAIIPLATLMVYGSAPILIEISIIVFYVACHYFWCKRFLVLYGEIFCEKKLRNVIYQEEGDAVYYMRKGDDFLLSKHYKFSQMPPDRYIVLFMIFGILMIPMMGRVAEFMGIPFAHIFLIVAMVPISCMGIGIAVRGFLVFYLYPARIKRTTGKLVYVDVVGKHHGLGAEFRRQH